MRDVIDVFKALSDATRLRIVCLLAGRELCVCELVDILDMSQSRISHQLQILKSARLVNDRRDGKWIYYSLISDGSSFLTADIPEFIQSGLNRDKAILEDRRRLKQCLKKKVRERCQRDK